MRTVGCVRSANSTHGYSCMAPLGPLALLLCGLISPLAVWAAASPTAATIGFLSDPDEPLRVEVVAEAHSETLWPRDSAAELARAAQPWFGLWLAEGKTNSPPLAGSYSLAGTQLRFRPSLPLLPGQTYTARLERPGLSLRAEHRTAAPASAEAPKLLAIYPTSDRLPANHLKFYIAFSEPMESGVFLKHCRLVDARGREVEAPFRETELWSAARRRRVSARH